MKCIYLYGASDDCHEADTDWGDEFETYGDMVIRVNKQPIFARFVYDGDWGIQVTGDGVTDDRNFITCIEGNCAAELRGKPNAGTFIVIHVPDDADVEFEDPEAKP